MPFTIVAALIYLSRWFLPALVTHLGFSLLLLLVFFLQAMASIKAKGKKAKGEITVVSPAKRIKRAGSKKQVSATTGQGQHLMIDDEVAIAVHSDVNQRFYVLIKMMADRSGQMRALSSWIQATQEC